MALKLSLWLRGKSLKQVTICCGLIEDLSNDRTFYRIVDTPLFRDHPQALEQIDTAKDVLLPPEEVVKAMIALVMDDRYRAGTVLEVNDIGGWREVQLQNDPGPQGHYKNARVRAAQSVALVRNALEEDAKGYQRGSKL